MLVRDVYLKGGVIFKKGHTFSVILKGTALCTSSFYVQLLIPLGKAMNVQIFGIVLADQTLPDL